MQCTDATPPLHYTNVTAITNLLPDAKARQGKYVSQLRYTTLHHTTPQGRDICCGLSMDRWMDGVYCTILPLNYRHCS